MIRPREEPYPCPSCVAHLARISFEAELKAGAHLVATNRELEAIVARITVEGLAPVVRDATKKDGWTIQDVARALCAYLKETP